MKINILFLIIGLALSIVSKILQLFFNSKIGNIIVIPAAIFLVLAALFSINKYIDLFKLENGGSQAFMIAFWVCLATVSFQLMMILIMGSGNKLGFFFIIPFVLSTGMFIYKWFSTFS